MIIKSSRFQRFSICLLVCFLVGGAQTALHAQQVPGPPTDEPEVPLPSGTDLSTVPPTGGPEELPEGGEVDPPSGQVPDNTPPPPLLAAIITAPATQFECQSAGEVTLTLQGSCGCDPAAVGPLTFDWTGSFGTVSGEVVVVTLPVADVPHGIILEVSDGTVLSRDIVDILVGDSTAPVLTVDTTPIVVVDTDCSGGESVTMPIASGTDGCGAVALSNDAPATFTTGQTTTVTYTATDGFGNASTATVNVTVLDNETDGDGVCGDVDNCPQLANPVQTDTDGDSLGDACDPDDDNDTVPDAVDADPFNQFVCADADGDGCDDCSSGIDDPANDGTDTDGDGICNVGDPDDDDDAVLDVSDLDPLNRFVCGDSDVDGCDDCNSGTFALLDDGIDFDGDGFCDVGDSDDDNDGVPDLEDANPNDPLVCRDADADGCDDCVSGTDTPGNDGADFDGDGLCNAGDLDDDNDGLPDVDEPTFGTDPLNPDSDNDGLLDGTEADSAMGSGCPSPTDPDSDSDTISDGDETVGGTNPCLADSDGDGVPDNEDPLPTEPGVTSGFLEDSSRELGTTTVPALELSLFSGKNNNANKGRRGALANRATEAGNLIAAGDIQGAIDRLDSLLKKIDGEPSPPDWMEDSPEKTALAEDVSLLISLLELQL